MSCATVSPGGFAILEYASTDSVDVASYEDVRLSGNMQRDFVAEWFMLDHLPNTESWSEDYQPNDQGRVVQARVGVSTLDTVSVAYLSDRLAFSRVLLRITRRNGSKTIVGTLETPLDFSAQYSAGTKENPAQSNITFSGVLTRRSAGYAPVF